VTLNEPRPDGINQPANLPAKDLCPRWLDLDRWADEHGL
jgi:hypothetical protein